MCSNRQCNIKRLTNKYVTAVGGNKLKCYASVQVKFIYDSTHQTEQTVYCCEGIDVFYFSKAGCFCLNILPKTFPHPIDRVELISAETTNTLSQQNDSKNKLSLSKNNAVAFPTNCATEKNADTFQVYDPNVTLEHSLKTPKIVPRPHSPPACLSKIPFLPTEENIPQLK